MDADRTQFLPVMIYREPMRLIVQVDDSLLGQVLYYWTYYGKPCRLLLRPARTENLTAVCLHMDNADAGSLVWTLCERLRVRLYEEGTMRAVRAEELFMY